MLPSAGTTASERSNPSAFARPLDVEKLIVWIAASELVSVTFEVDSSNVAVYGNTLALTASKIE
jgi:hypothetical protein